MKKTKVLISGGGPAGLTAGILLDKSKYEIKLVERGNHFMNMGFSIILWKAGHDILQKTIQQNNVRGLYALNTFSLFGGEDTKQIATSNTTGLGYSIKREDLMRELAERYVEECSIKSVKFNSFVKNVSYSDNKTNVKLSDGTKDTYDLIIVADGIHSGIRATHFSANVESLPFKITYGWMGPGSNLKEEALIGFMKDYLYLIQTVGDESLIAYYHDGDEVKEQEFIGKINGLLERERGGKLKLNDNSMQIFPAEEVVVEKPYDRRMVLVGDSYHGHTPTLGMGTSMALEDSYLLSNLLNNIDLHGSPNSLEDAFNEYSSDRHHRIQSVYRVQDYIEKLLITDNNYKVEFAESILKFGGWKILEPVLHGISRG